MFKEHRLAWRIYKLLEDSRKAQNERPAMKEVRRALWHDVLMEPEREAITRVHQQLEKENKA